MYLSRLDDTLAKSFPTAALPSLRIRRAPFFTPVPYSRNLERPVGLSIAEMNREWIWKTRFANVSML